MTDKELEQAIEKELGLVKNGVGDWFQKRHNWNPETEEVESYAISFPNDVAEALLSARRELELMTHDRDGVKSMNEELRRRLSLLESRPESELDRKQLDFIVRVMDSLAISPILLPDDVLEERKKIERRYDELKVELSFGEASRIARGEWLRARIAQLKGTER